MNDFSNISAESNLRDEITMTPDETMIDETDRHDDIDPNEETEETGWPGDGSGTDDLADYNANEADDYRDE